MKRFILGETENGKGYVDTQRLIDTRLLIQANSGGGKSWCLRRILERTHGQLQHLVIDMEGEFSSLRQKYDYVLASKQGGDTAAQPRAAKLLAERLLELGVSAVLDIYELKAPERIEFVKGFLEALVDAPKRLWHPALVVVDEAHVFCPEKGSAASAGAVIDLATRGRKRGFCAILATQRLAKLHKDAAAECNNKLIGRTGLDVDLDRASNELGLTKKSWPTLRGLRAGEFFAFGPAISQAVERVRVGGVETTHPKAGARLTFTAPAPTAKVKALLPKLADLPAEAEERTRTHHELRKQIRQLERELKTKKPAEPPAPKTVEVPVVKAAELRRVEQLADRVEKLTARAEKLAGDATAAVGSFTESVESLLEDVKRRAQKGVALEGALRSSGGTAKPAVAAAILAPRKKPVPSRRESSATTSSLASGDLRPRHVEILQMLVSLETLGIDAPSSRRLAAAVGLAHGSGNWRNLLGNLRSAGLIESRGSGIAVSDAGRDVAGPAVAATSHEDIVARWMSKLRPRHVELLEAIIASYPEPIHVEQLGEAVGLQPKSGNFRNLVGRLVTLGLIDRTSGSVTASEHLFP